MRYTVLNINGLAQHYSNSIAIAMELLLSCAEWLIWNDMHYDDTYKMI